MRVWGVLHHVRLVASMNPEVLGLCSAAILAQYPECFNDAVCAVRGSHPHFFLCCGASCSIFSSTCTFAHLLGHTGPRAVCGDPAFYGWIVQLMSDWDTMLQELRKKGCQL